MPPNPYLPTAYGQQPRLAHGRLLRSVDFDQAYRIDEPLGAGGFGAVYRCHLEDEPDVELAAKVTYDQASWVRELYFAELLATTKGVIHVRDAFPLPRPDKNGRIVYAAIMDLAPGGDLKDFLIDREVPLSETKIVTVFRRLLGALSHLHEGGAIHRDLTPANVFLDARGGLLLGDFGIARHRGLHVGVAADAFNPWYCPPEIDYTTGRWSTEQDIWQVGQLLAVTLQLDPFATIEAGEVRRLDCEPWLREIIYRAIGPQSVRFRSAAEMHDALGARTLAIDTIPRAGRLATLDGQNIVFTAGIPDLVRSKATRLARRAGAFVQSAVSYDTDLLVVGGPAPLYSAGTAGGKLMRAVALNEDGARIRTLSADRFRALV